MFESSYRSFLLRLWREPGSDWRVELRDVASQQVRRFASLEQLWAALHNGDMLPDAVTTLPLACPTPPDTS